MANRLARATSPYLLQHQDNPVDWWEWSEEAFAAARQRDVPVLLSIGYASCHWCHVMAHESFEDTTTAALMSEQFVNIKVDREERPDVDSVYMQAVQALTGRGGWPMTVFLDHEARPFFAGTYFPPTPRHGMPSFSQLLSAISDAWANHREDIDEQATRLVEAISETVPSGDLPDEAVLEHAYRSLEANFDRIHGGFGGAPKFPQQPVLEFLLRVRGRGWAVDADRMLRQSLIEMASGGIHDQIGGGFARYSVDERWLVPHFEKMLYDNAQLARIYLWAGIELDRPDFVEVARSTLEYLQRDLWGQAGGFFSAEDADSEGVEGKFYVWSLAEIREVLGDDAEPVIHHFGVSEEGNFEGTNILFAKDFPAPPGLDEAKRRLFEAREDRVRPGLDDKVVASWHGMAIRVFAETGAALADGDLLDVARRAASFVVDHLVVDGVLQRSWREGRTSGAGFLDDYASLAVGLFSLYAATGDTGWYDQAMAFVDELELFARPDGGYFTNATDSLVVRPFDVLDNPHPSGNALAAEALFFAHLYTGEERWRTAAESALSAASALMSQHPSAVAHHLSVLESMTRSLEVAIVGPGWRELAGVHFARFRPHVALAGSEEPHDRVPLLASRTPTRDGLARAFVCRGFVCEMPVSSADDLARQLSSETST